ncbi:MAG TPA: hypothetical protein VHY84_00285 [Bryobacteraceae bacterium]|jgi:hypothetical protein|nr:hypothetical protein [Bryobacteraceae bacterium]
MASRLELEFNEHPDAQYQAPPTATILIKDPVTDSAGTQLLSKRCASLSEFEAEIESIKNRLERIREEAAEKFQPTIDVHQEILNKLGVAPDPADEPEYDTR